MLPVNPKEMEKMLRRMGIRMENIEAEEVVISCEDKEIVIHNPVVQKIDMKGVVSFQIQGNVEERQKAKEKFTEEDVKLVMEKTNASKEDAIKALAEADGDIVEAIMRLSG